MEDLAKAPNKSFRHLDKYPTTITAFGSVHMPMHRTWYQRNFHCDFVSYAKSRVVLIGHSKRTVIGLRMPRDLYEQRLTIPPAFRSFIMPNSTIPPDAILNPYTTLAFLPPQVADQFQVMCYVYVATLAAYTWDWLMSMPEEYTIIRKVGFSYPNLAYFVSRVGTLGSCASTVIFRIAPIDNCAVLRWVEGIFFAIAVPATSLLFLFRVMAVYNRSRIVTAFFGVLWLSIAGLSILIMLGITGVRIPYTRRCTEGLAHTYTTVPIILTAVNDTLIFIAITCRLLSFSMVGNTWRARAKSFFTGVGLHHLSKALLQSGQAYYLSTIGFSVVSTALILSPSIPGPLHPILATAYFALASAMACRVFRAVLLGTIIEPQLNTTHMTSFFREMNDNRRGRDDNGGTTKHGMSNDHSVTLETSVAVETATRTDIESYDGYVLEGMKVAK